MTWVVQPGAVASQTVWDADWVDDSTVTLWDSTESDWSNSSAASGSWSAQSPATGNWE